MRIGEKSFRLILTEEISNKARYEAKYRGAINPGWSSGPTIGIGYDLKHHTPAEIRKDWGGRIPDDMLRVLIGASGKPGSYVSSMRGKVDIPYDVALAVFREVSLPKWEAITAKALPNTDLLPPDAFGALVSLTYNRGAAYYNMASSKDKSGRGTEMRAIRKLMSTRQFDAIPAQFRAMARLWTGGVAKRRHTEARLFANALKEAPVPAPASQVVVEDKYATPDVGDADLPIAPNLSEEKGRPVVAVEAIPYDPTVYRVQCRLRDLGYYVVGEPDGKMANATRDAVLVFRRNEGLPLSDEIDDALLLALDKAGKKPIGDARATVTGSDLAPKVEAVRASKAQKFGSWLLGLPALIGSAIAGAFEYVGDAMDQASPILSHVRDAMGSVPVWAWGLGVGGIALYLWRNAHRAETDVVQKYQDGRLL
jgi:hypothetical protein